MKVIKLLKNFFENRRREKLRQEIMQGNLIDSYYDEDWTEAEKAGFIKIQISDDNWQSLFKILADFCNRRKRKLILDIGCGPYELMAVSNKENTVGVDASKIALIMLKRFGFKGQTVQADALHLPFVSKAFDCLVSNQVIEHLFTVEHVREFITQAETLASDIIIVTPNCAYHRQINDPTHFHFFTTKSLKPLVPNFKIYGCSKPYAWTLRYYFLFDSPRLRLTSLPVVGRFIFHLLCKIDDSRLMAAINSMLWSCGNLVAVKFGCSSM